MRCHNTKPRTSVQPIIWLLSLFFLLLSCATWSPRSSAAGFAASWPYKADVIHSQQMVVVEAKSIHSQTGQLSLYQKAGGQWQSVLSEIPVTLGSKGIGKINEGDGRTPPASTASAQASDQQRIPADFVSPIQERLIRITGSMIRSPASTING